jgi:SAM-dependent methyltransferase
VRGAVPSPNIWQHPATYEIENAAVDRDGLIESAMRSVADWSGRTVLDVGCGTGYHLPRFAATAARVHGVEPHPALLRLAARRTRRLENVSLLAGAAQALPLPDASVDVAHARWAYFFGPGCEPGLRELARVVRRGGAAFVVDNDGTRSTWGRWFRRGYPDIDPAAVERFWARHGWTRVPLDVDWRFDSRADLEAVVRIELPAEAADVALAEHQGTTVDYAVNLWWRRF